MTLHLQPPDLSLMHLFILSGGRAARADGANKSFFRIEGKPILDHQLDQLRPVFADRITIVTDRPDDYAGYPVRCVPDSRLSESAPERASLRGIVSALDLEPPGWRFLLANDMPWPDPEILAALARLLVQRGPDRSGAVLVGVDGRLQPFHSLIHDGLLPSACDRLKRGELGLRDWLRAEPGILPASSSDLGVSATAIRRCLTNFNTSPPS